MKKIKVAELVILTLLITILIGIIGYKSFFEKEKEPAVTKKPEPVQVAEPGPEPEPEPEPVVIPVNFDELKAVNPDVYAYIEIPGTQVSYPILQSADNSIDYLNTTFEGAAGLPGSIYTENINNQNFMDFNTVIYGHNMRDKSMFGSLHNFDSEEFFRGNTEINIYLPDQAIKYHIYAALEFDDRYIPASYDFNTPDGRNQYLNDLRSIGLSPAYFNDQYTPNEQDSLITLATCTSVPTHRLFIIGVRDRPEGTVQ